MSEPTYIEGICRTNLDEYAGVQWPYRFVAVPRYGERVRSVGSGLTSRSLYVVQVTHCFKSNGVPYIEVELHKESP